MHRFLLQQKGLISLTQDAWWHFTIHVFPSHPTHFNCVQSGWFFFSLLNGTHPRSGRIWNVFCYNFNSSNGTVLLQAWFLHSIFTDWIAWSGDTLVFSPIGNVMVRYKDTLCTFSLLLFSLAYCYSLAGPSSVGLHTFISNWLHLSLKAMLHFNGMVKHNNFCVWTNPQGSDRC